MQSVRNNLSIVPLMEWAVMEVSLSHLAISGDAVPDSFEQEDELGEHPIIAHLSEGEFSENQRADKCNEHVVSQIERGEKPLPAVRSELPDLPLLLRVKKAIVILGSVVVFRVS